MQKIMFGFSAKAAVLWGHGLLMLCGILYSIAWFLNRDDAGYMDNLLPWTMCVVAVLCGVVGGITMLDGLKALALGLRGRAVAIRYITLASLGGFIAIMLVTLYGYDRMFTAELSLVFVWAIIELCTAYVFWLSGWLSKRLMFAIVAVTAAGLYLCSMCYNFYYVFKYKDPVLSGLDIPNKVWMGILPYAVLVVVIAFVLISVYISRKLPAKKQAPGVRWEADFVKRGRSLLLFWLLLGLGCIVAGLLFNLTLTYHPDFLFTVGIVGAALFYFLIYYPPGYHISFADPDLVSISEKISVKGSAEAEEVVRGLVKRLKAKGYKVREIERQKAMPDVELRNIHVIEVQEPRMLVLARTGYAWPMPWRTTLQFMWGEVTDENNDLAWDVDEMVGEIVKSKFDS